MATKVQKTQESTDTPQTTEEKLKFATAKGIEKLRADLELVKAEAKVPIWGLKAMEVHIKKTERRWKNSIDPDKSQHRSEMRKLRKAKKMAEAKAKAEAAQAAPQA